MTSEELTPFTKQLLAWTYSMGFPVGVSAIIYLRVRYGYDWPPANFGLVISCSGLILLLRDIFVENAHGRCSGLKRQSLYSDVWASLLGLWLYGKFLGDSGLALLITLAFTLWPLSHRELLRLKRR